MALRTRITFFLLGTVAEVLALWRSITASSWDEAAYWLSLATWIAVVAVAMRQVHNGHGLFSKDEEQTLRRASLSEAGER